MDKNIIIAGSTGMVGTAVMNQLLDQTEFNVYAMSYQNRKETEQKYKNYSHIHVFEQLEELPNVSGGTLLNFAFPRSMDGASLSQALEFTRELAEQAVAKGIDHLINVSSQSIYLQSGAEIQTEQSAPHPVNLYGMAKFATEKIIEIVAEQSKIDYTNIRLGSIFSVDFDLRMTNRFVKMIKEGRSITVDRGTPMISYLHIEDAAAAFTTLLKNSVQGKKAAPLYNVANNEWMTVRALVELANEIAQNYGYSPVTIVESEKESTYNNVCNSDLFYEEQDWKPKYHLKEMLMELFQEGES